MKSIDKVDYHPILAIWHLVCSTREKRKNAND